MVEAEFASTLRVSGRQGNTLSPLLRQAWDSRNLRVLTKNTPARSTGAHIPVIGHITRDELLRYLDSTEAGNGFANRFLWLSVHRSKVLPEGGNLDPADLLPLSDKLRKAVEFAREVGQMRRDEEATAVWHTVYPELSDDRPSLFGAVTSRAEAIVMRLACLYALLDLSAAVRAEHLKAALALWDYAEQSACHIFGASLGDPVADTLLGALKTHPAGPTRTQLSEVLSRNVPAVQIQRALELLARMDLARCEYRETATKAAEVWIYTGGPHAPSPAPS